MLIEFLDLQAVDLEGRYQGERGSDGRATEAPSTRSHGTSSHLSSGFEKQVRSHVVSPSGIAELTVFSHFCQVGQLEPCWTARLTSQGIRGAGCRDQGGRFESGVGRDVRRLVPCFHPPILRLELTIVSLLRFFFFPRLSRFDQLRTEVLRRGISTLIDSPATTDPLIILAGSILSEASTAAYWVKGDGLHDMIGLKLVDLALRYGMNPSSSLG